MNVGDTVTINTPDNPRLHGTAATVAALAEWGAHLTAAAAAAGCFRAAWCEMVGDVDTAPAVVVTAPATAAPDTYTGDICGTCGGMRMRRTGTCMTCEDCGTNEGCG